MAEAEAVTDEKPEVKPEEKAKEPEKSPSPPPPPSRGSPEDMRPWVPPGANIEAVKREAEAAKKEAEKYKAEAEKWKRDFATLRQRREERLKKEEEPAQETESEQEAEQFEETGMSPSSLRVAEQAATRAIRRVLEERDYKAVAEDPFYAKHKVLVDSVAKANPSLSWQDAIKTVQSQIGVPVSSPQVSPPGYKPTGEAQKPPAFTPEEQNWANAFHGATKEAWEKLNPGKEYTAEISEAAYRKRRGER